MGNLRSKRDPAFQAVIGWINAWPDPDKLKGYEEFNAYWNGADLAGKKLGYQFEEFRMGRDVSPRRLDLILASRGIRALLLPPHHTEPVWNDFPWDKYFIIKFGRSLHQPASHLATADQVLNTVLAFERISALGYRRIGFVTSEPYMNIHGHLLEAGFRIAQQSVSATHRLPVLSLVGMNATQRVKTLAAWVKKCRPDAIYTDVQHIRALLNKAGIKVPDDVAVAATTIRDTSADAGIDQHPDEIGRVGMLFLHSLITDGAIGIPKILRQTMIQGSWVDGTSMPPMAVR